MLNYPTVQENLEQYIDAGFPLLYIRTFEETKADAFIGALLEKKNEDVAEKKKIKAVEWNGAKGFVDFDTKSPLIASQTLESTLKLLTSDKGFERRWLIIKDADDYLKNEQTALSNATIVALLKEIARKIRVEHLKASVMIVSSSLHIPPALEKLITVLELELPDEKKINAIIENFIKDNNVPTVTPQLLEEMSLAFKGLSESEIMDLLNLAFENDGKFSSSDLQLIFAQKKQMIMKAGVLEMVELKEEVSDIGGLERLKEWLGKKSKVFKNSKKAEEFGVATPKGVLIAGLPGCGKSLTAKAAGKLFDVPLLRLDMGRLMGRYVGESEENMRKAIRLAEAISPCVLWVDELEKAFAGIGGGGSEVTTRLFGTFLTWMQEKTEPVFVLATANKIVDLPPELLRKGRFDEIFYVSLPNSGERKKIFEIHIKKRRKQDFANIDINALVEETDDYTGADIEGIVSESVENAFIDNTALTTELILKCIENTHSLSEVMGKEIGEMAAEYEQRKFKPASS